MCCSLALRWSVNGERLCSAIQESKMVTNSAKEPNLIDANKSSYSVIRPIAVWLLCLGVVIGVSSVVFWPISLVERWHADHLLTAMLVAAFAFITIGCHCFDIDESRRRNSRR